jgi:hypothetical protein
VEWFAEQVNESDEACNDAGPNSVKFVINCDKDIEKAKFSHTNDCGCQVVFTKTDKTGCLRGEDEVDPYAKLTLASRVFAGIGLVFYGAKFMRWLVGFYILLGI